MSPLEDSIRKTLAYFRLFNYPLTKEELFAYLWAPPRVGYDEFISHFQQTSAGQIIDTEDNRRRRLLISEHKLKKAVSAVKKIRAVPFLRAVFVCNSAGSGLAGRDSDIDFFIITEPRRIWLVRFFTNFIYKFLGLRTYGKNKRDKICLSYYADSGHLDLSAQKALDEDIHFAYWLHQMIPIFDPLNYYEKFLSANKWTEKFLPNISRKSKTGYLYLVKDSSASRVWRKSWESLWNGGYGDMLEAQAKGIQLQRLKMTLKGSADKSDRGVVLGDEVIKLHEHDTRLEIHSNWQKKYAE